MFFPSAMAYPIMRTTSRERVKPLTQGEISAPLKGAKKVAGGEGSGATGNHRTAKYPGYALGGAPAGAREGGFHACVIQGSIGHFSRPFRTPRCGRGVMECEPVVPAPPLRGFASPPANFSPTSGCKSQGRDRFKWSRCVMPKRPMPAHCSRLGSLPKTPLGCRLHLDNLSNSSREPACR